MKPFDLQAALSGSPVITRDGRPVKIAGYNENAAAYCQLTGWIMRDASMWCKDGTIDSHDRPGDLFMAPIENKEWIVRVKGNNKITIFGPYNDFGYVKTAYNYEMKNGIATIHEITVID